MAGDICSRWAARRALLIGLIRNNVQEPARWENKVQELGGKWTMHRAFLKLFSPQYRRRTIVNSHVSDRFALRPVGRIGVRAHGDDLHRGTRGTNRRRKARAARVLLHGAARHHHGSGRVDRAVPRGLAGPPRHARDFLRGDDVRDLAGVRPRILHAAERHRVVPGVLRAARSRGANFIVYSFWLPEQYGTECRASAFAFITNLGRFIAAGFTFHGGGGIRHIQTFGIPVAMTALAFVVGLALVPFGEETKGKHLPA